MIKKIVIILIILIVVIISLLFTNIVLNNNDETNNQLDPIYSIDPAKYSGLWYSIYEKPLQYGILFFNYNSIDCVNSTAYYTIQEDSTIHVLNSCVLNNKSTIIEGTARFKNTNMNGELEVSFFPFIWSDYNIIGLELDYEWAVVGTNDHTGLWYLSRTPTISDNVYKNMNIIATSNGFDISDMYLVKRTLKK